MKLKKIAATALVPAAVAGVSVSGWAAVKAATSHPVTHQHHERALPARHAVVKTTARQQHRQPAGAAHHPRHQAHATRVVAAHRAVTRHAAARPASAARPTATPAPAPQPPAPPTTSELLSSTSAFEQCVAWHESGDNPTASSSGMFGILPATWASLGLPGTAGEASVQTQMAAFSRLYAEYGTSPWAAYDGC